MITLKIEGMSCGHCKNHVEEALNALDGIKAVVSLENKEAVVEAENGVDVQKLVDAVLEEGYTVTEIIK